MLNQTKNLRLLFVEDNEAVRVSVLEVFEQYFDNITIAVDGVDGLDKFTTNQDGYDLIISDISMPNLNGLEMAKKIRELDEFIPIIFLTAFTDTNYLLDSIKIGIDGYLSKPLDLDELNFALKRILFNFNKKHSSEHSNKILHDTISKNVIMTKTDLKGIITYTTDAFCNISGYSREELLGKSQNIVRHPDMPNEIFMHLWSVISDEQTWEGEVKNLKKDGGYYWVHATISPDYNFEGEHIGYISIRRDIAMQKEVELLNTSLEMKAKDANEDLAATLKHTRESIEYAALIQGALLPEVKLLEGRQIFHH